jgi:predicted secreted acid phosphatase
VEVDDGLTLVEAPYLTDTSKKPYTLVLDLDETLLHYFEKSDYEGELKIRPGADDFLF